MSKQRDISIIFIIILVFSAGWIAYSAINYSNPITNFEAPFPGFDAPQFSVSDSAGTIINSSNFHGKPILLFTWTSWCPICKSVMPNLQEVYLEFQENDIQIMAVNISLQDQVEVAQEYIAQNQFTFPIYYDLTGDVANKYNIRGFPTTFLINSEGIIIEQLVGGGLSTAYLLTQMSIMLGDN